MKKDWEIKKLGDICETGSGGTPLKGHKEYFENGTIPWLRSGEVCKKDICESELFITETGLKKSSAKLFPINTVLVAMYGATAGQTGILRFQSTTNQAVCGILPNSKLVPEFIYYFFLSYKDKLIAQAVGGAQPNISQVKICNSPIPVPPLEEQKRIVKILDEKYAQLESLKANAQNNLQNAKDLFQSQLTKAFSNNTWEKKRLGEVCDVRDGTHDSPKFYDKGYPLVTSKNLKNGKIEMINLKYISKEDYEKINERSKVDINDILFAMIGTIGNPVLVTEEPTYAIKNMALIKDIGSIFPNYLLFYLSSNCALDKMLHDSNGTTQRFVSLSYLRNFEIPLPPLPEQKRIVEELDTLSEKVRQLQEIYTKQIANCDELKQALLQKAFEGEL